MLKAMQHNDAINVCKARSNPFFCKPTGIHAFQSHSHTPSASLDQVWQNELLVMGLHNCIPIPLHPAPLSPPLHHHNIQGAKQTLHTHLTWSAVCGFWQYASCNPFSLELPNDNIGHWPTPSFGFVFNP